MRIESLTEAYQCPKCKARNPLSSEIAIPSAGAGKLPLPTLERYLSISCSLCGYTEMYNLKIVERSEEKASQRLAQEASS